jgi:23S rRNA-/tRNA-specific pseudouridylate synthase
VTDSEEQPGLLYENNFLLVLNKPPRWHTTGEEKPDEPSLETWIRKQFPTQQSLEEAGLVHRLDFLTSGCVLAVKNQNLREKIFGLRSLEIQKIYWVLAERGLPPIGSFELSFESRYKRSQKVQVSRVGDEKTKGKCQWRKRGEWSDPSNTKYSGDLLEVRLLGPGKRHQIRAGFSFLGASLFGDPLYGREDPRGLGLHARTLVLPDSLFENGPPPQIMAPPPLFWNSLTPFSKL